MRIQDVLKESCVLAELKGDSKQEVLKEMVSALKRDDIIDNVDDAVRVIMDREKLGSTGIGDGIAIPHGKLRGIDRILCVFGKSKKGVDFDAVDRKPVHILFLLLAPDDLAGLHIKMLSRISRILRDQSFRRKLIDESSAGELYGDIIEEDKKFGG